MPYLAYYNSLPSQKNTGLLRINGKYSPSLAATVAGASEVKEVKTTAQLPSNKNQM